MPKITFIEHGGTRRMVDAATGVSLMEAARAAGVAGIIAECGGVCACATCQIYVDDDWQTRVGAPGDAEAEMLEFTENVRPSSRLSCQITVSDALEGLIVTTADGQS